MMHRATAIAPELTLLPNAIGGCLYRRLRGRSVTYWRLSAVQIRDEDAFCVAMSSVARPIY